MLKLTRPNFSKLKQLLLRQKKKVENDLKGLEEDDPVLVNNALAESSEPGTDSWLADTHSRVVAIKRALIDMLDKTKKSLMAIKVGKYGKCENCGNPIEPDRLAAMPTAILCISCSKKLAKK